MYQRILVPIDGSSTSDQGLAEAIAVAKLTGGRIRLLHVFREPFEEVGIDGVNYSAADVHQFVRERGELLLSEAAERVRASGIDVDSQLVSSFDGRVCDIVATAAQAWPAELVVIGTHGRRGVGRLLLGSDAEQILRLSPAPVLLVRAAPAQA